KISRAKLARMAEAFHDVCADRLQRSGYRQQGAALSTLLAPAMNQLVGMKRLIVCPDGPLWNVPFAALSLPPYPPTPFPHKGGKGSLSTQHSALSTPFLIERFEIAYAYSATGAKAAWEAQAKERVRAI